MTSNTQDAMGHARYSSTWQAEEDPSDFKASLKSVVGREF